MTNYRRDLTPGACWFFTLALANRKSSLLIEHIEALRTAFRKVQRRHPWRVDAIVILPNHLHALCTLPAGDADYALRWRQIKGQFSRTIPQGEPVSLSRHLKNERGIWQRRYWEHRIRDANDLARHLDYIHFNPCKHGLVTRAADWPWSSFHHYVRLGLLPADWAGGTAAPARHP
ncbi:transposase [Pseudomonas sp. SCB32]|uniref:REP-associated tyrosine transposase n=1 Tax=Pseudomonas sp. SCB32 TaxID=2653853 RepID=UPI00126540D2|nr:transposase [Pseudomonas sp. SCB32]